MNSELSVKIDEIYDSLKAEKEEQMKKLGDQLRGCRSSLQNYEIGHYLFGGAFKPLCGVSIFAGLLNDMDVLASSFFLGYVSCEFVQFMLKSHIENLKDTMAGLEARIRSYK
jgi:hypothetical protein